jgi:6-phosphofructokinase 1
MKLQRHGGEKAVKKEIKTLAVLTSGGDAPGMNACVRAVVRAGVYHGLDVIGYEFGYRGLLSGSTRSLDGRSVSNIIQRGGTILGSSRCPEFETETGQRQAAENLRRGKVDALVVIGGDGSFKGARALMNHWEGQVIGVPGTIDNDLGGTDYTIGYFTALDTALGSIDRIRDTAEAFDRIFLVEVMGRMAGDIAEGVGVAGGAEEILVPEAPREIADIARRIHEARDRGKLSYIIVVAEGFCKGGAIEVARQLTAQTSFQCRTCVLGHTQRGGSPVAHDRILGTRLGVHAVEAVLQGATGVMVGVECGEEKLTRFEDLDKERRRIAPAFWEKINTILSR